MALGLGRWQTWLLMLSLACGGHTLGSPDRDEGEKEPSSGSGGGKQGEGGRPASQAGRPATMGGSAGRPGVGAGGTTPNHTGGVPSVPGGGQSGVPQAGQGLPVCVGDPNDSCIKGCETDLNYVGTMICRDGRWQCPADEVRLSTCAPDSCAATSYSCCDYVTGHTQYADCGPDGRRLQCPAPLGQIENGGYCSPNGNVCTEGASCPVLGYECHFPRGSCTCEEGKAGPLWSCQFLLI